MLEIPGIDSGAFRAAATTSPEGRVQLRLEGFADVDMRDSLALFLQRFHEAVLAGSVPNVDLDLAGLEYLSSACIRPVLQWLRRLHDTGVPYGVLVLIRSESFWQRRSALALVGFAPTVVSCDVTE